MPYYRLTGFAETQYGWRNPGDEAVPDAVCRYLERQNHASCSWEDLDETDQDPSPGVLVSDADSRVADFDPTLERFPAILARIKELREPIKPSTVIAIFEDVLLDGDDQHEQFEQDLCREVWGLSTCSHADWMQAYAESPETPPHIPVFATDRWVLGYPGRLGFGWEHLRWREVPGLTGAAT